MTQEILLSICKAELKEVNGHEHEQHQASDSQRRQERTGGNRRGEATQGGALMDDYGDVYDKIQILSQ